MTTQHPPLHERQIQFIHDQLERLEDHQRALCAIGDLLTTATPGATIAAHNLIYLLEPIAGGVDAVLRNVRDTLNVPAALFDAIREDAA